MTTHDDDDAGATGNEVDMLADLLPPSALFHDQDGKGFVDLVTNGHRETWPINSARLRHWLAQRFFQITGGAPKAGALRDAIKLIGDRASFEGPAHSVYVRVAGLEDRLYLDLGDDDWRAIEIDASGWRTITSPPVRFRRSPGMQPLPVPLPGGQIDALRPFLNLRGDDDFVLVVAWLLACLRERGPYPVLVLIGEPGTSKSTTTRMLRALVDPSSTPLRAPPGNDRDLFIQASSQHLIAIDNVSAVRPWLSDTLCQLATGGGFATRRLRTDTDEVRFNASRPIVLNGIANPATRSDLIDRALVLPLARIPDEHRRTERELLNAFAGVSSRILGALLDAVAQGLKLQSQTKVNNLPRMADFAHWASACETAFWPEGTFMSAYHRNRGEAMLDAVEADPVAMAIRALMATRMAWSGTATDLLRDLGEVTASVQLKPAQLPKLPQLLAAALNRAAPLLQNEGLQIAFSRMGHDRTRMIRITRADEKSAEPSASSARRSSPGRDDQLVSTDAGTKAADAVSAPREKVRADP